MIRKIFLFCFLILWLTFYLGLTSCINREKNQEIRFGICADVHKDIMHDADERLQAFIDYTNQEKVDFTIQLGDFCRPYEHNDTFLSIWNSFEGPHYHVLGNHDMDGGFTKEQTIAYLGMKAKYYSFDKKGFHFIILDGNDTTDPPQSGYARYIGEDQKEWLKKDLASTDLPCILFSHQRLEDEWGVENATEIQRILEDENERAGKIKVLACFNGHSHLDGAIEINGIWYVEVNSLSYFWVGGNYKHLSYSKKIDEKYPWIKYTCPYKNPLYALVTVSRDGTIKIEGSKTEWVGSSPAEIGYTKDLYYMERIKPEISDMILK